MKRIITLILSAIMLLIVFPINAIADETSPEINRYNVVFVIDASTSMKHSDEKNNRFEATDLFLGMLANEGNYVGTVTFNGNVTSNDIVEVNGNSSKKSISQTIRSTTLAADTNIGGALLQATTLLEEKSNKKLPSIIILLSDGNTDFDDPKLIQESKEQKETALEIARDNGYSIYAVSLNNDGKADAKELSNIAKATKNGMFEEVNSSADLKGVFDKFYTNIYGTQSTKLVDETIGVNGSTTNSFTISDVGVEEVNIAIFGDVSKCYLTKPSGTMISDSEMNDITFAAETFRILKLVDPEAGNWNLTVEGAPGASITVVKTYNVNLNVQTNVKGNFDEFKVNTPIEITAKLFENTNEVTDKNKYNDFNATMKITDFDGNVIDEINAEEVNDDGYKFTFTPTNMNTYYADITVENDEVFSSAERLTFNVGNTIPVAKSEVIKKHINIWPFLIKTNSTIDLTEAATDNEDEMLNYKVVSATWNDEDYTLDGSNLTIDSFKETSKGSFEVQAFDSQGAFCTFNVKVTSTNIGVLTMILIIVGILLALIALAIVTKILADKAFMGEVQATNIQTRQSNNQTKSRGQLKLTVFPIGDTGFDKSAHFQATGKDYIYFVSKKPVSTDSSLNKLKKIKIENNMTTRIYSDDEHTKGIEVRFLSYNNNKMY